MNLTDLFKASLDELRAVNCIFAVGGGFAADLYRKQPRGTSDIDYLFLVDGLEVKTGKDLLKKLNLAAGEVKLHQLTRSPRMHKKSEEVYILVGRTTEEDPGVDLLLPSFPWFQNAIQRAQNHLVDFGFGPVPTITAEDVLLAKLFAKRPKDIDDIISIFDSGHALDLAYLAGEMERLKYSLPDEAVPAAPKALKIFAKRTKRRREPFPPEK
jgi:hypothetical protein